MDEEQQPPVSNNGDRDIAIREANVESLKVVKADDPESRRVAWVVVCIGMVMLLVLLGFNIATLLQNNASERRQDALSDCFRRVILTIDKRTEYNEKLRSLDAQESDAASVLVQESQAADGNSGRVAARNKYLKKIKDVQALKKATLAEQAKYPYPELSDCGST